MATRISIHPRSQLIEAREGVGISRPALAAKLSVSPHFAMMIENGRQNPSLPMMQRWLAVLGETSLDLFQRDPDIKPLKQQDRPRKARRPAAA